MENTNYLYYLTLASQLTLAIFSSTALQLLATGHPNVTIVLVTWLFRQRKSEFRRLQFAKQSTLPLSLPQSN